MQQRNNRGPSLPTALTGITISLTVSQFAHIPSIAIPLSLPLVSSALRKRKTNSFPYKWSESLQPRDPAELQIFHLCLGALCYYSLAIIPSLSFFVFFFFTSLLSLALLHTHLCYPYMLMLTLPAPPSFGWSPPSIRETSSHSSHRITAIHAFLSSFICTMENNFPTKLDSI